MRIVGGIVGGEFRACAANFLKKWWPGTELNRRRQPFQTGLNTPSISRVENPLPRQSAHSGWNGFNSVAE
jgi:hypothetical protein